MCHEIACATCSKPTWEGCGEHIEYALKSVPLNERCACPRLPVTIEPKAQNTTKR